MYMSGMTGNWSVPTWVNNASTGLSVQLLRIKYRLDQSSYLSMPVVAGIQRSGFTVNVFPVFVIGTP
jgi:hypothetical protein